MGIFNWLKKIKQIFLEDLKKWETDKVYEVENSDEQPVPEAENLENSIDETTGEKQETDSEKHDEPTVKLKDGEFSYDQLEKMMVKDNLFDVTSEELYAKNKKKQSNITLSDVERLKSYIISTTILKLNLTNSGKILIGKNKDRCEAILYFYLYWIALSDTEPPSLEEMLSSDVNIVIRSLDAWKSDCENCGTEKNKFPLIDMKSFMKSKTSLLIGSKSIQGIENIIEQAGFIEEDQRIHFVSSARDIIGHDDNVWEEEGDGEAWDLLEETYINLANDAVKKVSLIVNFKMLN